MKLNELLQYISQKVWAKLQALPQASSLELGAFFVIILFIATFLFFIIMSCAHCYFCGKPKYQVSRVQPV